MRFSSSGNYVQSSFMPLRFVEWFKVGFSLKIRLVFALNTKVADIDLD